MKNNLLFILSKVYRPPFSLSLSLKLQMKIIKSKSQSFKGHPSSFHHSSTLFTFHAYSSDSSSPFSRRFEKFLVYFTKGDSLTLYTHNSRINHFPNVYITQILASISLILWFQSSMSVSHCLSSRETSLEPI